MVAVTVTGSVGGTTISFNANSAIQAALARQVIAAAASAASSTIVSTAGAVTLTTGTAVANGVGAVLSGSTSLATAQVALAGNSNTYLTNGTLLSTVTASDNSTSVIVNNTPLSGLVAATGAGANVLAGFYGANQFVTGVGGQDLVILNGAANILTSNGSDAVLVGGPSTVTAASTGVDNIALTSNTTLAFVNGSAAGTVDSITGAAGSTITLAGPGSTSVVAGGGNETFNVDTSAGNTTLVGNSTGIDNFTFLKDANVGTANVVVNNLTATDLVNVHGYAGYTIGSSSAGAILQLSDGSSVTFTGVSAATLTSTVKIV